MKRASLKKLNWAVVFTAAALATTAAFAGADITGKVEGGGGPIAKASVTLWAARPGTPRKLAETQTKDDGSFELESAGGKGDAGVRYLIAKGGEPKAGRNEHPNPAITLMATLGTTPPKRVTVNELTTVASAFTGAQFVNGDSMSGNALGLRIAAGNVPNFVDLETGGLGTVIQNPLNSSQTTTLATFSTLGDLLAGCVVRVRDDACAKLFAVAAPPSGAAPVDTLDAAVAIARNPWHRPRKLFELLDHFYPPLPSRRTPPPGPSAAPFRPYLSFVPGDWTLTLTYAGGGLNSLGGVAIDGEGNAWAADNFQVGSQSTLYANQGGGVSELAPNGRPISPMTFGYTGGGVDLPGFGLAIGADGRVWVTSLASKTISAFDRRTGRPLSPATGYDFGGKLGAMQGIITTPSGDVWAVDNDKSQIVYFPKGDPTRGRLLCVTVAGKSSDGTCRVDGPFHLATDQKDRIWITNGNSETVTRFPASDPGKAVVLKVGYSPKAIAIDSQGDAWVNNAVGSPSLMEKLRLLWAKVSSKVKPGSGNNQIQEFHQLYDILMAYPGGNVTLLRPDGSEAPGSPFDGAGSIYAPWGIAVDGNDNIWVANGAGHSITELCGVRTGTCPRGDKTGDPISPPKTGYRGHGLQILTDLAVDPAGDVWVANNWDKVDEGFKQVPDFGSSTRFGGNGFVVFFGIAKPVRTPLIGPPRAP